MIVYKFGGASVRSADAIKNAAKIVSHCREDLMIVVSAFGKTTNALEGILKAWYRQNDERFELLRECKLYHLEIIRQLFDDPSHPVYREFSDLFDSLENKLNKAPSSDFDFNYDQLVTAGELLSTKIVSAYLNSINIKNQWLNARDWLLTDDNYREALVCWEGAGRQLTAALNRNEFGVFLTQGFIGGNKGGFYTTLGREGSDYTAAILASLLDAQRVVIWKDVPGVLTADPKIFPDAEKIDRLSYLEAIELSFFGAKVIHPKTVKPLQNKNIPLFVKSFYDPQAAGTVICDDVGQKAAKPVFIIKKNQLLISIVPKDFSFVAEGRLSQIFAFFFRHRIKVNLIQNSAVNFSLCVDNNNSIIFKLTESLRDDFSVRYNQNLELVTIRYYTQEAVDKMIKGRSVLLEQRTRNTVRFVLK